MLTAKSTRRKCAKCAHSTCKSVRSFHGLPRPTGKNIEKCRQWARFIFPDENWDSEEKLKELYRKNKVICSGHFTEKDFTEHPGRHLNRYAIPHVTWAPENRATVEVTEQQTYGPSDDSNSAEWPLSHNLLILPNTNENDGRVANFQSPDETPSLQHVPSRLHSLVHVATSGVTYETLYLSEGPSFPSLEQAPISPHASASPSSIVSTYEWEPAASSHGSEHDVNEFTYLPSASSKSASKSRSVKLLTAKSILRSINVRNAARLRPRERWLYKNLVKQTKKNEKLRKTISKLKSLLPYQLPIS